MLNLKHNNMHTSKEFSQRIAEKGFKGKPTMWWEQDAIVGIGTGNGWTIDGWKDSWRLRDKRGISDVISSPVYKGHIIKAYDIIYDICIKYPKEFFGEKYIYCGGYSLPSFIERPRYIFSMLQQGKTQKEIEDYIIKHIILLK